MQMVQVQFIICNQENSRASGKLVWVDKSWDLKIGDLVTFKGEDDRKWSVAKIYDTTQNIVELDKKWGLELPKSQRTER